MSNMITLESTGFRLNLDHVAYIVPDLRPDVSRLFVVNFDNTTMVMITTPPLFSEETIRSREAIRKQAKAEGGDDIEVDFGDYGTSYEDGEHAEVVVSDETFKAIYLQLMGTLTIG